MTENQLFELLRTLLLAQFDAMEAYTDVVVKQMQQPRKVGVPTGPAVFIQLLGHRRVGSLKREELPPAVPGGDKVHVETQWWETTVQINALVWRDPALPNLLALPTSNDIAKMASNILQSDTGLAALAVQRVRPLRITDLRNVPIINDRDEYEQNPSFDLVLSYPEIRQSTTPPAVEIVPVLGRV